MESISDTSENSFSAMMMLSPVSINILVVIVGTLLIVVATAVIDKRRRQQQQQLPQQRSKQRNSQRRRSRGAVLIDFGLMWSTVCGLLKPTTKDTDNTSVVEQQSQQQTVSAKKSRKYQPASATVAAAESTTPSKAVTAAGDRVESTTNRGGNNKAAAELQMTNASDSDDDDAAATSAGAEEEDEEEEYELEDDEDCDEEDEEEDASSDDESDIDQLPDEKSSTKTDAPAANIKRDSITSAKSSPKAQQQAAQGNRSKQQQQNPSPTKAGDAATFKTRVFTNKSVQNRNATKQQQQNQKSQTQRKNSNESNKLKASVLLIEEMYQPVTRKASMQKASSSKKVDKEQSAVNATNPFSSGDEQSHSNNNKNKIKASKNFTQQQATGTNNPTAANKNWSRKSQTFTEVNTSTSAVASTGALSASAIKSNSPFEQAAANKSPQQQRTSAAAAGKKSKETREVVINSAQVSTTASPQKKPATLHQYKKLNLSDEELVRYLHHYLLDVDSLKLLGFPVECEWSKERAVIYKPTASEFYSMRQQQRQPTDLFTPAATSISASAAVPLIPVTVEAETKKMPLEDLVDDGIETDALDLKSDEEEDEEEDDDEEDESGEEERPVGDESKTRRRKRRAVLNRLSSVKLLSSSPPSSSSGNSSGIEDSSESNSSLPGSPSIARLPSKIEIPPADEKKCSRCGRGFFVTIDGEYLTQEHCVYHYGRVQRVLNATDNSFSFEYSCCAASPDTKGCTTHNLHVWSGVSEGCNGPFLGFLNTKRGSQEAATKEQRKNKSKVKRKLSDGTSFVFCADMDHLEGVEEKKRAQKPSSKHQRGSKTVKVFALDCEMCFTGRGLELAKVTVVAHDGSLVYEKFVQPESEIIDYNTRFSGIKPSDFHPANRQHIRSIQEVQRDLVDFIDEQTILIGHGLENDLRALKLIHKRIIDTSIAFPHFSGLPFRRSLKSLTKSILKRDIQTCQTGHDSYEDSLACVELMLWRVRKDFRTSASHNHNHSMAAGYGHQQQPQPQQHQSSSSPLAKRYHGNGSTSNGASSVRWS